MKIETLERLLLEKRDVLLEDWRTGLQELPPSPSGVDRLSADVESVLDLLLTAAKEDVLLERDSEAWHELGGELELVARTCQERGFDWEDVAALFSGLRQALTRLILEHAHPEKMLGMFDRSNRVLDHMTLQALTSFLRARDVIIERQQREVMELSVPVTPLWPNILVLPLIGSLDSHRAHVVLETLLTRIDEWGAKVVLIDITGASTVDTTVAQNIIKTVTAARLMGTECIITGIRPQIAQTIVHLGINLDQFETKATLAEGLEVALRMTGYTIRQDPK